MTLDNFEPEQLPGFQFIESLKRAPPEFLKGEPL